MSTALGPCPCTSGKDYSSCCEPYVGGVKPAPTAEALMRSRYTAYARNRIDYLTRTHHASTRDQHDPEKARQWSLSAEWLGLEIKSVTGGGESDREGTVEFVARYKSEGEEVRHHEISQFRKEDGLWYFVDGQVIGPKPIQRESPKVGRNDPCPCGSGKKYKKCCGV